MQTNKKDINLAENLIKILDEETELYEIILEKVLTKQKFLVQNKDLELRSLIIELDKLTQNIKEIDEKRKYILEELGIQNKNLTWLENYIKNNDDFLRNSKESNNLNFKLKNIPTNYIEIIIIKTKKIKELIIKISEINNANVFLINQGKKNIKAYFDLLFKQLNKNTYSNEGILQNNQYKNLLINKIL